MIEKHSQEVKPNLIAKLVEAQAGREVRKGLPGSRTRVAGDESVATAFRPKQLQVFGLIEIKAVLHKDIKSDVFGKVIQDGSRHLLC